MTLSNSETIFPGEKLPRDPPCEADAHVEKSWAQSAKVASPVEIILSTTLASALVGTKMCRAEALMASGGGPYSLFSKALEKASKSPMERAVVVVVVDDEKIRILLVLCLVER